MCCHAEFQLGGERGGGKSIAAGERAATVGSENCYLRFAILSCVFSLSVLLLFLFPLFAVLLNCPYPDPPVFCLFLFILLFTPAGEGVATWHFRCRPQPNYN